MSPPITAYLTEDHDRDQVESRHRDIGTHTDAAGTIQVSVGPVPTVGGRRRGLPPLHLQIGPVDLSNNLGLLEVEEAYGQCDEKSET